MKFNKTNTLFLLLFVLFYLPKLSSQNNSIVAAMFNLKDGELPLVPGKGFLITDPLKETRNCFTTASTDKANLSGNGSKKTSISVYYAESTSKLSQLKSNGFNGKIGFLSLAKVGYATNTTKTEETENDVQYLVIVAKVDFGRYNYKEDLVLKPECQKLIDDNKHAEFVKAFGSHYVSGIKKESELYVILKANEQTSKIDNSYVDEASGGFSFNGILPSAELTSQQEMNNFLSNFKFELELEMHGGNIEKNDLIDNITKVLDDKTNTDKINTIKGVVSKSIQSLTNPDEAAITQYYYAPLENYGVKNIFWDDKKELRLININKDILLSQDLKANLKDYVLPTSLQEWLTAFDEAMGNYSKKEVCKQKFKQSFNGQLNALKNYNLQNNSLCEALQKQHSNCADISCDNIGTTCCPSVSSSSITMIEANATAIINKLEKIYNDGINEALQENIQKLIEESIPECEKKKMATLLVKNKSNNPYNFYENDTFVKTLQGGEEAKFTLNLGQYFFKAVQNSGYVLYPTVNNRHVSAQSACEEITIKVGFAD